MARNNMDEQIRYVINQAEEQEECNNQDIYQGVTINNIQYDFQEMSFFEDRLSIYLPNSFTDMPDNIAKLKYPSGERPQIIKTDKTGSINLTLSHIANHIDDDQIPEVKEGLKRIYKQLNPSYLYYEEGIELIEGKTIGYFEFKSPAIDVPLYNLLFVLEMDHDVVLGCFNCPYETYTAWRPVARQMMNSLRIIPKLKEAGI